MDSFSFILFLCLFIFLFFVFAFSREDFVLFRKGIPTEKVFNFAFLTIFVSLFISRLVYVAFHFAPGFIHPLVFFIFPYFPGLSQAGASLGGMLFVLLLAPQYKLPRGRIYDIFTLSFIGTIPFLYVLEQISLFLQKKHLMPFVFIVGIAYIILFIFFLKLFEKNKFIDGSVGYMATLAAISVAFLSKLFGPLAKSSFALGYEDLLFIVIFFLSLLFLLQQEKIMPNLRKLRKR